MKIPLIYKGTKYASISDFCRIEGVSYTKLQRLCRTYRRAQGDPTVAIDWLLGEEALDPKTEPRTVQAFRDAQLNKAAVIMRNARRRARRIRSLAGLNA